MAGAGPDIQLIEPELVALRGRGIQMALLPGAANHIPVRGRVESVGGLRSLTINGLELKLAGGTLFKAQIPVTKPEEQVRIVAIDRVGRKSTLEFLIRSKKRSGDGAGPGDQVGHLRPKGVSFGNYHALVVGNNEYRLLPRLQTAVHDAKDVARILREQYGFKVRLLLNASRYDILSGLNDLRERLTDNDNLLIYYAGHGELDERNQRGHWLPVDAEPTSSANWISNVAITDILNAMTVQQLLVVVDSCYSGTLTRSTMGRLEAGISEEKLAKVFKLMAHQRSRMVMTSGGLEPVLDSAGGKHSVFAKPFIELLQANVGVLQGQEMFQLLQLRVAAKAQEVPHRQVPEYAPIKFAGHESGGFFFVRTDI